MLSRSLQLHLGVQTVQDELGIRVGLVSLFDAFHDAV